MRMIVPSGVTIIAYALYLSSGESSASFVGVVTWKDRPKPGVSENFVGARGARVRACGAETRRCVMSLRTKHSETRRCDRRRSVSRARACSLAFSVDGMAPSRGVVVSSLLCMGAWVATLCRWIFRLCARSAHGAALRRVADHMRFVECEGAERLDGFDHALQLFGGPRHALRFAQCVRPSAASHARVATGSGERSCMSMCVYVLNHHE